MKARTPKAPTAAELRRHAALEIALAREFFRPATGDRLLCLRSTTGHRIDPAWLRQICRAEK